MLLPLRIVIPTALVTLLGYWWLGGHAVAWGLGGLAAAALIGYVDHWNQTYGPAAIVKGLVATWSELPGAEVRGHRTVSVHDGMQPIAIQLARRGGLMRAVIQTPVGTSPVAWRVWSREHPAPPLAADLKVYGGPPVTRAAALEAAFGGVVYVEATDVQDAAQQLDTTLRQAILQLKLDAHQQWRGVTYDGRVLGVHLAGPTAADPEQATALARSVWKVLT